MEVTVMMGSKGREEEEEAMVSLEEARTRHSCGALLRLKEILIQMPSLMPRFLPQLLHFQKDVSTDIRKQLTEILAELGLRNVEYIPAMVPVFVSLLRDEIPIVARSMLACGTNLFRRILEQVASQGIHCGYVDKELEESWLWLTKFKDAVYSAAFQGNDALRWLALKFVETIVLLFTPDLDSSSQPPTLEGGTEGPTQGFNVAWIVGGHPLLDSVTLMQESSRNLSLLLDQLRPYEVSKLPVPVTVLLVYSLASIARKRSSLCGRILPHLLRLGSSFESVKRTQAASIVHALKSSFLSLLKCAHPMVAPWRERLVSTLKAMNAGEMAEAAVRQVDRMLRNAEKERILSESRFLKEERMHAALRLNTPTGSGCKRAVTEENGVRSNVDNSAGKRARATYFMPSSLVTSNKPIAVAGQDTSLGDETKVDTEQSQLEQIIAVIGALVAKGERAASSIELLITSLEPDMLADVVIQNMKNLPATPPLLPCMAGTTLASLATLEAPTSIESPSDHRRDSRRDPRRMDPRRVAAPVGISHSSLPPSTSQQSSVKIEEHQISTPVVETDASESINSLSRAEFKMPKKDVPVCEALLEIASTRDSDALSAPLLDTVSIQLDTVSESDAAAANKSFLMNPSPSKPSSSSANVLIEVASLTPTRLMNTEQEATRLIEEASLGPRRLLNIEQESTLSIEAASLIATKLSDIKKESTLSIEVTSLTPIRLQNIQQESTLSTEATFLTPKSLPNIEQESTLSLEATSLTARRSSNIEQEPIQLIEPTSLTVIRLPDIEQESTLSLEATSLTTTGLPSIEKETTFSIEATSLTETRLPNIEQESTPLEVTSLTTTRFSNIEQGPTLLMEAASLTPRLHSIEQEPTLSLETASLITKKLCNTERGSTLSFDATSLTPARMPNIEQESTLSLEATSLTARRSSNIEQEPIQLIEPTSLTVLRLPDIEQESTLSIEATSLTSATLHNIEQEPTLLIEHTSLTPTRLLNILQEPTLSIEETSFAAKRLPDIEEELTLSLDATSLPLTRLLDIQQESTLSIEAASLMPTKLSNIQQESTLSIEVTSLTPTRLQNIQQESTLSIEATSLTPTSLPNIEHESTLLIEAISLTLTSLPNIEQESALSIEPASLTPTRLLNIELEPTLLIEATSLVEAQDTFAALPVTSTVSPRCLPSIASVVELTSVQQETLSKDAVLRILEGHKEISAAGSGDSRLALLARLVSESSGDKEVLSLLQKHIIADYQKHKGHELTLNILYMLYAAEISVDGMENISTTVVSMYEMFLLSVLHGVRDTLPALDKSMSRLLGEAPLLPEAVLQFLHALCNPALGVKEGLQKTQVDRVTQGLRALWSLILTRPPVRIRCLDIVMQCTVHQLDDVRTKAIFLAVKKLFPLNHASQRIEDFALRMLHSVVEQRTAEEEVPWSEQAAWQTHLSTKVVGEIQAQSNGENSFSESSHAMNRSVSADDQIHALKGCISLTDATRRMSLFLALCSEKYVLLGHLFSIYGCAPKSVKQVIHRHMPVLIRAIGSSAQELLHVIASPPSGSKNLVMQVLHILTESAAPSLDLISIVKNLHEKKLKDAAILIPILSSLSKDEVLPIFPRLVDLPIESFKIALARILQGSVHSVPAMTPVQVVIAIHGIDPVKDSVALTKVKDACSVCFQQRTVFTQQVLQKALDHLVEQTPLPMLFMRTVIQTVGSFRSLVEFVMEVLSRLVSKQIWKSPKLWVGFLKCAEQTQPHSYNVLLQLPAPQLDKALHRHPNLRAPLTSHARHLNTSATLPRSILVVLGLVQDIPASKSPVDDSTGKETEATESPSPL